MKAWQIGARRLSSSGLQRLPLQLFPAVSRNIGTHHRFTSANAAKAFGTMVTAERDGPTSSVDQSVLADVTVIKSEDAAAVALAKLLDVAASDPERMFACDTEVGCLHVYDFDGFIALQIITIIILFTPTGHGY